MKYPKQKERRNLSNFKPIDLIEGETIEDKCKRLVESKEPIIDGAPILYTERKDGVLPAYDIRTDRWAIAQEAMDKNRRAIDAKRKADYDLMLNGKENNAKADKSAEAETNGESVAQPHDKSVEK